MRHVVLQTGISLIAAITLLAGILFSEKSWAYGYVPLHKEQQVRLLTQFYFQAAIQVAAKGGNDLAEEFMQKVYALNPDNLLVAMSYAELLETQQGWDKAVAVYEDLLKRFSDPLSQSMILYRLGMGWDVQNKTDLAIPAMEKAKQLYPKQLPPLFYYNLGVMYAKENRFDQTKLYTQRALEGLPTFAAAWNNLGYSMAKLGDFQNGYLALEKSLALDPDNAEALDSMGYILYHLGRIEEAIDMYEKAVAKNPNSTDSLLYLGKSYEATQSWAKAVSAYERYLALVKTIPSGAGASEHTVIQAKVQQLKAALEKSQSVVAPSPAEGGLSPRNALMGPAAVFREPASREAILNPVPIQSR